MYELLQKTNSFSLFIFLILFIDASNLKSQSFVDDALPAGVSTSFGSSYYGGGVSFVDFDRDGWDDLTIATDYGDSILFYKNNGNGTFIKLTSLVGDTSLVRAVLWVDIDNDYDLDLFITSHPYSENYSSGGQDRIYENVGGLNFVDITSSSGILIQNDDSFGAAFGDYDKDGDLDLYVSNRIDQSIFYQNNGNKTFTDITSSVGILIPSNPENDDPDMCSAFIDFDNDNDLDLYAVTDKFLVPNRLYIHQTTNHFVEDAAEHNAEAWVDGMNAGFADMNNDGWFDVYITNTSDGNRMLLNNVSYFNDIASQSNTQIPGHTSWGAVFVDVDNDKDLDLYVCTEGPGTVIPWRNYLFNNNGESDFPVFTEYDAGGLPGDTLHSFSTAVADFNNDGYMDIVVSNSSNEPVQLWKSQISNSRHYINFALKGDINIPSSNSFGIGSRIEIYDGDSLQTRYMHCGINYLGQNSLKEHVGMGYNSIIDSIIIKWPSGTLDKHYNLGVDQNFLFEEGKCLNHTYTGVNTAFNKYIGTNGNLFLNSNWSRGHVPKTNEDALIKKENAGILSLTNSGTLSVRSLTLEGIVNLTNNGTINILKGQGYTLSISNTSILTNNNRINITNPCGKAIILSGNLQDIGPSNVLQGIKLTYP